MAAKCPLVPELGQDGEQRKSKHKNRFSFDCIAVSSLVCGSSEYLNLNFLHYSLEQLINMPTIYNNNIHYSLLHIHTVTGGPILLAPQA